MKTSRRGLWRTTAGLLATMTVAGLAPPAVVGVKAAVGAAAAATNLSTGVSMI